MYLSAFYVSSLTNECAHKPAYKKRDDEVDLLSDFLDISGPESPRQADLGTVCKVKSSRFIFHLVRLLQSD